MGCGCKKNKNTQVVTQPAEVKVTEEETVQQTITLLEQQQRLVDEIVNKLNQVKE